MKSPEETESMESNEFKWKYLNTQLTAITFVRRPRKMTLDVLNVKIVPLTHKSTDSAFVSDIP